MWVAPLLGLPVHASSGDKVVRTKEDEKGLGAGRGQNIQLQYVTNTDRYIQTNTYRDYMEI